MVVSSDVGPLESRSERQSRQKNWNWGRRNLLLHAGHRRYVGERDSIGEFDQYEGWESAGCTWATNARVGCAWNL